MAPSSLPARSGRSALRRVLSALRIPVPAIPVPAIPVPAIRVPVPAIRIPVPAIPINLPVVAATIVAPALAVVTTAVVVAAPAAAATVPCTISPKLVPSCGALLGVSTQTGANQTWDQALTAVEQQTGRKADVLHDYHQWDTAFPSAAEAARAASGQKLLYTWKGTRQDGTTVSWSKIAAGAEDTVINAEATRVANMHTPVFVNFQNEPESSIGASGTAADYVAAWRHIHDRFVAAGATNAVWTVVYMGVTSDSKIAQVKALYPGNDYVDYIAWDPYNWAGCRSQASVSFAATVSPFYNWLMDNGYGSKPFMLAEYGTVEDPANPTAKADWFTAESKSLASGQFPNLKVLSYFNYPAPPASCTWSLDTSAASVASYATLAKDMATRSTVPTTVPGIPTGVAAVAGAGSAVVSWTPPTNTGGGVITGYRVTVSPGRQTVTVPTPSVPSAIVTGLTPATSYRFTVTATTIAGDGAPSVLTPSVTPTTTRVSLPAPTSTGWKLNGTTTVTAGGLQLTDATTQLSRGSAFWPTPIASASSLLVSFDENTSGGTGSDGLALALADADAGATPTSLGRSGGGLGWSGTPGTAVAVDTHANGSDPSNNFIGLATGASTADAHNLIWQATSSSVPSLRTLRHITVAVAGGVITVSVDGVTALQTAITLPAHTLIGFTASDGMQTDQHLVSNVTVSAN